MTRQTFYINSTIELLNIAKGTDSDSLLAEKLKINRSSISNWRKRKHVGIEETFKLALMAGADVRTALAVCAAEQAPTEELKAEIHKELSQSTAMSYNRRLADVAQSVEQLIRNQ